MGVITVLLFLIIIGILVARDKIVHGIHESEYNNHFGKIEDFKKKYCDEELERQILEQLVDERYFETLKAEVVHQLKNYDSYKNYDLITLKNIKEVKTLTSSCKRVFLDILMADRGKVSTDAEFFGYYIGAAVKRQTDLVDCLLDIFKAQGVPLEMYCVKEPEIGGCEGRYYFGWYGSFRVPATDYGKPIKRWKYDKDFVFPPAGEPGSPIKKDLGELPSPYYKK